MQISQNWHRRQAIALVSTLPEEITDARIILGLARELLDSFLADDWSTGEGGTPVSRLPRGDA